MRLQDYIQDRIRIKIMYISVFVGSSLHMYIIYVCIYMSVNLYDVCYFSFLAQK